MFLKYYMVIYHDLISIFKYWLISLKSSLQNDATTLSQIDHKSLVWKNTSGRQMFLKCFINYKQSISYKNKKNK